MTASGSFKVRTHAWFTPSSAASHFEAMMVYHQYLGWEPYTTDQPWDMEPYPDDWRDEQVAAGVWRNE